MTNDEKKELEHQIFHRLQVRAIVIGVPVILGLLFTFAQIVKGEKGKDADPAEVAKHLKKDSGFVDSIAGENGKNADFEVAVARFRAELAELEARREKILGEVTVKVQEKIKVWSQKMQIVEKRLNLYHQNVGKLQREVQSRDDLDREIANYLLTLFEHVDFANYFITQFYMKSPKPNPEIFSYTTPKAAEINQKTVHELKKQLEEQLKKYN